EVGAGLSAHPVGDPDGQAPGGVDPTREHAGDGARAVLAGHEGLHDRPGAAAVGAQRVGPAGDQDEHDGGAGGEHGLDQLVLGAGQLQALDVAALAGGAGAEQTGDVAHGYDGELGGLRGGHGLGDAGGVGADEVGAGHGGHAGRGEHLGKRVGGRGHDHGGAVVLEAGQDVVGEAVAAQEAARLDGGGSDQRDRGGAPVGRRGVGRCGGGGAAQREQPVGIVEQDDRLLRHAPSESAALGGVEVD